MRGLLVTCAVACTLAAGVGVAGWAVQAAALPPPTRADRVVARAVAWFLRYRLVESRFRIDGGPSVRGRCLQGWVPRRAGGGNVRGTVLAMSSGRALVEVPPRPRVVGVRHGEPRTLPLVQLELAGCSRIDGFRLADLVQTDRSRVERAFAAGRPALAIRVPTERTRLTVYVTPRTFRPFAIATASARFAGRSRIWLTPLTPSLRRSVLRGAGL